MANPKYFSSTITKSKKKQQQKKTLSSKVPQMFAWSSNPLSVSQGGGLHILSRTSFSAFEQFEKVGLSQVLWMVAGHLRFLIQGFQWMWEMGLTWVWNFTQTIGGQYPQSKKRRTSWSNFEETWQGTVIILKLFSFVCLCSISFAVVFTLKHPEHTSLVIISLIA